jgi:hypothetical protein
MPLPASPLPLCRKEKLVLRRSRYTGVPDQCSQSSRSYERSCSQARKYRRTSSSYGSAHSSSLRHCRRACACALSMAAARTRTRMDAHERTQPRVAHAAGTRGCAPIPLSCAPIPLSCAGTRGCALWFRRRQWHRRSPPTHPCPQLRRDLPTSVPGPACCHCSRAI